MPTQTAAPRTLSDRLTGLATTPPARRHVKVGLLVGLIAGIFGGFIKLGWEVVFPPRVASRTPEPTVLLHQLGISANSTYSFSSHNIAWATLVIHFGFSIAIAILYVVIAEYSPKIKLWMGAAFGIAVWIGAHLIVMPILGLSPHTFSLPWDEDLSEFFGHIVWMVGIEIVRRDLRSRITHEPDAEVGMPGSAGVQLPGSAGVARPGSAGVALPASARPQGNGAVRGGNGAVSVPGGNGGAVVGHRAAITGSGKILDGKVLDGKGAGAEGVDGALNELASGPIKPS